MNERRAQLAPEDRQRAAEAASARLLALPEVTAVARRSGCVAGFAAVRTELDPAAALDEARRQGARVVYPRVHDAGRPRLRFHVAESADLRPGKFGIPEPPSDSAEVAPADIDVIVVPGLAFDAAGGRVGYGGGYYDELLDARAAGVTGFVVGFGYDFQVVGACPVEAHDRLIDCVVTDARVLRRQDEGGAR